MCDNIAHAVVPVNSKSERVGSKSCVYSLSSELSLVENRQVCSTLYGASSQSLDPTLGHNCARSRSQHEADNQSSSAAVSAKHGIGDGRLLDTRGNVHIAVLDDEVNRQRNSVWDVASGAFPELHLAKAGLDGINRFQVLQVVKSGNATRQAVVHFCNELGG